RLRPVAPLGHRLLHRPEEVIHAGVADELEALLQVRRELLVIVERAQVLFDPSVPLELEQRVGVMHDRRDLRSAADDALVLCELVDLAVTEACDALGLEVVERLLRRWPLHVDDAPVHAGLEDGLRKLLEIVVDALRRDLRRWPFHSLPPRSQRAYRSGTAAAAALLDRRDTSVPLGCPPGGHDRQFGDHYFLR